jgi:hypothetical protein
MSLKNIAIFQKNLAKSYCDDGKSRYLAKLILKKKFKNPVLAMLGA